jgi:glucokinase
MSAKRARGLQLLVGDVGGTNVRLALYESAGTDLQLLVERNYASREHRGVAEILERFLDESFFRSDRLCLGVAGPVRDGRCAVTNLPWVVDAGELAARLHLHHAWLLNDLEAFAYGLAALAPRDFAVLAPGDERPEGNAALIAAGTGLGEAGLFWDGTGWRPFATEGGHAGFAPESELEIELLRFLRRRGGRVTWERVLSGPGLVSLFEFFLARAGAVAPVWFTEARDHSDPAAAISAAASEGRSQEAIYALDLFVRLYGAEAGNLALKMKATGGVFLGGGIAPKMLGRLQSGAFLEAFHGKEPMRELLERIPVRVVTHRSAALLGAARYARLAAPAS